MTKNLRKGTYFASFSCPWIRISNPDSQCNRIRIQCGSRYRYTTTHFSVPSNRSLLYCMQRIGTNASEHQQSRGPSHGHDIIGFGTALYLDYHVSYWCSKIILLTRRYQFTDARTTRHLTTRHLTARHLTARHLTARHLTARHHYISPPDNSPPLHLVTVTSRHPYISPPLQFASTQLLIRYI
jgi:hypothetical protein